MVLWGEPVTMVAGLFLLLALALSLSFEFVNGFHDTANAVATVIYTHTLKPTYAVVWSGCWNLLGVLWSSGAVAYSIVALLPVELVLHSGSGAGFSMIFALLISAIIWNVGTWYLGLPASSSHTMIGAIMGVGVANSIMAGNGWTARHQLGQGRGSGRGPAAFPLGRLYRAAASLAHPEVSRPPQGSLPSPRQGLSAPALDSRRSDDHLHAGELLPRLQ